MRVVEVLRMAVHYWVVHAHRMWRNSCARVRPHGGVCVWREHSMMRGLLPGVARSRAMVRFDSGSLLHGVVLRLIHVVTWMALHHLVVCIRWRMVLCQRMVAHRSWRVVRNQTSCIHRGRRRIMGCHLHVLVMSCRHAIKVLLRREVLMLLSVVRVLVVRRRPVARQGVRG